MKKIIAILSFMTILLNIAPVFALSEAESEHLRDMRVQPKEPKNAPRWEDYVPAKYENPRTDFRKAPAVTELTFGIILTDLIVTSPIGVPMICHSSTKLKNISYSKKKTKFFDGIEEAKTLPLEEQEQFYKKLLKKCKFKKMHID